MAELLGGDEQLPGALDGVSFLPTLLGKNEQKEHDLYWAFFERKGGRAIRSGNWKLIQQPIQSDSRLYDLSADIGEENNLAGQHPKLVRELEAKMDANYEPSERWKFPTGRGGKKN